LRDHIGRREGAHLQQLQIDELLVLPNSLQLRKCLKGRRHRRNQRRLFFDGEEWLGAGSVYNKDVNRAEDIRYFTGQSYDLSFATHVRLERMGVAASLPNALAELFSRVFAIEVVDRNARSGCSLREGNGGP
jgi:hypothetical protein